MENQILVNDYCVATLNYADGEQRVRIADARRIENQDDWCERGFRYIAHHSQVQDWTDEEQINRTHCPEIVVMAKAMSGCDEVVAYPCLLRNPEAAEAIADSAPIHAVHSDFTYDYGPMLQDPARDYQTFLAPRLEQCGISHDQVRDASRLIMLQFWRNLGAPFPDAPLAICDARTVPADDLEKLWVSNYGNGNFGFETFLVNGRGRKDHHQWFTYPGMSIDDVLAFRTYDSQRAHSGEAFWTPHTAFSDPTVGAHPPPRASVEMRALCIFN